MLLYRRKISKYIAEMFNRYVMAFLFKDRHAKYSKRALKMSKFQPLVSAMTFNTLFEFTFKCEKTPIKKERKLDHSLKHIKVLRFD